MAGSNEEMPSLGVLLSSRPKSSIASRVESRLVGLATENLWKQKNMYGEEQPHIGNCPHCTKVIFKDATFNSEASFSMRCPHCQKTVKVQIKRKIEIITGSCNRPAEIHPNVTHK